MEEADKDWVMIRMVGGWVSVSSSTGSPGSRTKGRKTVVAVYALLIYLLAFSDSTGLIIYWR